jgi:Arc/MetJ family transcription regulator
MKKEYDFSEGKKNPYVFRLMKRVDGDRTMGRTTVVLNDKLVAQCMKATGIKTKRALIDHALRELLRRERQKRILELKGTVDWEGDLAEWRKGRTS